VTAGRHLSTLPKEWFARLLSQLLQALEPKQANNIKIGFRKCSIFPLNKDEVIPRVFFCSRVNDAEEELSINQAVSDAVLHTLNQFHQVEV
jgi:hypothetical protein